MAASVKDVAARAGVSLGTVSNVLNRPHIVSPATRDKVELAIADLGFVRNEAARRLRGGESRMLAYVMLDQTNPFFTDLSRGMEQVAREHGLGLLIMSSDSDAVREDEYLELLLEQRVRGVLITAIDYGNPRIKELARMGMPVIFVDRADPNADYCTVGVDDQEGGWLAIGHLLEQGHRRIAFVGGPTTITQVTDRLAGAERAIAASSGTLTDLETTGLTVAQGRQAVARILGIPKSRRPTAVFCANDLLALGLLQELIRRGIRVPEEMAIVGYDDIEFAEAAAIPLTSVRQPRLELGRTAAELLLEEASAGTAHKHRHVRFAPELAVRASSVCHEAPRG